MSVKATLLVSFTIEGEEAIAYLKNPNTQVLFETQIKAEYVEKNPAGKIKDLVCRIDVSETISCCFCGKDTGIDKEEYMEEYGHLLMQYGQDPEKIPCVSCKGKGELTEPSEESNRSHRNDPDWVPGKPYR